MQFQGADYALCGAAALFVGLGLYRGFSGVFASVRIWPHVVALTDVAWLRIGLAVFAGVVVFGVVRIIVKKVVNGLLDQPVDAIAGLAIGVLCSGMLLLLAAHMPAVRECSSLARWAAAYVQ